MPVPSMPQPAAIAAKPTVESPDGNTNGSAATGEIAATHTDQTASQPATEAGITQAAITENVSDSEKNPSINDKGSATASDTAGEEAIGEDTITGEELTTEVTVAEDTVTKVTVADTPVNPGVKESVAGRAKSPEDILQEPVISKIHPSQAVLAAVAPEFQNGTAAEQQAAVATNPAGNTNDIAMTYSVSTATLGLTAQSPLKSGPQPKRGDVPQFAVLTADDRVQNAITLLNNGDERRAEKELAEALVIEPNNRAARQLMRQLHESPADFFAEDEYFHYVLKSNETLFTVAKKFLDDPLDFYMLARYNNIKYPNSLVAGKRLIIPGEKGSKATDNALAFSIPSPEASENHQTDTPLVKNEDDIKIKRAEVYYAEHRYQEAVNLLAPYADKKSASQYASVRELLEQSYLELANAAMESGDLLEAQAILESAMEALPENKPLKAQLDLVRNTRESERLYRLGVQESQTGKQDQAIKSFAKALQLNPGNERAKKQITDLRLTVVENYHKEAMVLYRKQELSQAIEIWDTVLQLDPNHQLAKQYRSKALELKRKIEQL